MTDQKPQNDKLRLIAEGLLEAKGSLDDLKPEIRHKLLVKFTDAANRYRKRYMNFISFLFTFPSRFWDSIFLPDIRHIDELFIICPDPEIIKELAKQTGESENVIMSLNKKVCVNGHYFELANNEIAFVTTRNCWWKPSPSITVAIMQS